MIKEGKLILPDEKGGKGTAVDKTMRLDSHVHANDPNGEKGVSSVNLKVKDLLERRYDKLQSFGRFTDTKADAK